MNIGEAKRLTGGGLGYPSKMPGASYGISARACITGAKLNKVPGSTCHGCYALKANYLYPSVATAHARRLESISDPAWSAAMATLINKAYEDACHEYTDLIHKHARQARHIARSLSIPIGYPNQTAGVGYGLGQCTRMDMDTIRRHAVLSPAMYPLTLPRSGAIVAISPQGMSHITPAEIDRALIQTICSYLVKATMRACTPPNAAILLPEGLTLQYFMRFHDSGDLQSVEHLTKICAVAALTPKVKHWLPTRELGIVKQYEAQGGTVPDNLLIRVSATMVDGSPTRAWLHTSTVHTVVTKGLRACPAPTQGNKCLDCRACWSKKVANVSYHLH